VSVLHGAAIYVHREALCARLANLRLPSSTPTSQYVDAGCLLHYGSSSFENARECARYVDRILRGASPADMPVRQPSKVELTINARTAKAIGLAIAPIVRLRADRVIE